jgi:hypothetical protein
LKWGDSIRQKVEDGIKAADWLIILLSEASVQSKWVKQELDMAFVRELEERNIFILPAVIDSCEIPLSLRQKLYADFRTDYKEGLEKLIHRLHNLSSEERTRLRKLRRYCERCDEQLVTLGMLLNQILYSGHSFLTGVEILSKELGPPLSDELRIVLSDTKKGDIEIALRSMLTRIPTRRMQLFVLAFIFRIKFGGSLDALLQNLEKIEQGKLL